MEIVGQSKKPFLTDHLYLSAFLVCRGNALAGTEAGEGGRVQFCFENTAQVRNHAADFLAGGQVEARQYSFELLKLKKHFPRPSRQWR